jgi:peptidoglycan/LPS O-acetylase OafA/YrhL
MKNESLHSPNHKYRADIDGLRAIAVLAVVGFHVFPEWLQGGFVGVDIFFVISGFLISRILYDGFLKGDFSFLDFYARRVRRIFPALIFVLIACFIFGWFYLLADEYKQLGKHMAGGAGFISNFLFWNEAGYFDSSAETKPLLHLWSLGIEEQFYIIWPLLLWVAWKRKISFLTLTLIVGVTSFLLNIAGVYIDPTATFYSPPTRFWELLCGSLLALVSLNKELISSSKGESWFQASSSTRQFWVNVIPFLGAFLIAFSIWRITKLDYFPGFWAALPVGGAVLIIASGAESWFNRVVLSNKWLTWFGSISFPLYLWHWPLISFVYLVENDSPTTELRFGIILVSILLAWLTNKFIEKPLRFGNKLRLKTFALVFMMLLIGVSGYVIHKRKGLEFRSIVKQSLTLDIKKYNAPPNDLANCKILDGATLQELEVSKWCFEKNSPRKKPLVFMWGDSLTENLAGGVTNNKLNELNVNLLVAMRGGCAPFLGYQPKSNWECADYLQKSMGIIEKYKPDTVMLVASWFLYHKGSGYNHLSESVVASTILKLKEVGVKKILIVGQFPAFEVAQPKLGYKIFIPNQKYRTAERLYPDIFELDAMVKKLSEKNNVEFLSPLNHLCENRECLISAAKDNYQPMIYDQIHMTHAGAVYFVNQAFTKKLLH